jgi:hypothetical protein
MQMIGNMRCDKGETGEDGAGLTAACHVVAKELRRLYYPVGSSQPGPTNSIFREQRRLAASTAVALARSVRQFIVVVYGEGKAEGSVVVRCRQSASLAMALAEDRVIEALARQLQPQADLILQVGSSSFILPLLRARVPSL